jgi:hypothetical protein
VTAPTIDLRDLLPAFEAAARRLLVQRPPSGLALVYAVPARCHPRRPLRAQGLCASCYAMAWNRGTLPGVREFRTQAEFVADYEMLRSEGYTRRQIAERLHMKLPAVYAAYSRAVRAGALTPDRRTA